jgi:hypothetical protein
LAFAQTPVCTAKNNFRFRGFAGVFGPHRRAPGWFGQKATLARAPVVDVLSKNETVLVHVCTV